MLRGSQVCSALQPPAAAWVWPAATAAQRWAAHLPFSGERPFFGPLKFVAFPLPILVLNPKLATGTRLPLLDVVKNSF